MKTFPATSFITKIEFDDIVIVLCEEINNYYNLCTYYTYVDLCSGRPR